jgi:tetratricopeptide (TPR) repeat protein
LNRDHALFLLIGLLAGFLGGYLAHETVVGVQPARVAAGSAAAAPLADGDAGAAAGSAAAAAGGAPMAEVARLQAALEKNPDDTDALVDLANLEFDIQRWDRAAELYRRYLTLRPDDPDVLTDLGITLRAQGHFDQALDLFRKAAKGSPTHWQSLFNEVVVLAFDKKDFGAAAKALTELEVRAPGNADVARLASEVARLKDSGG